MSAEREYWIECKMIAKHDIAMLQARSLMGESPPTAEEWGAAFQAVRDTTFEAAKAEMQSSISKPIPASHRSTVPGRVTMTFSTLTKAPR